MCGTDPEARPGRRYRSLVFKTTREQGTKSIRVQGDKGLQAANLLPTVLATNLLGDLNTYLLRRPATASPRPRIGPDPFLRQAIDFATPSRLGRDHHAARPTGIGKVNGYLTPLYWGLSRKSVYSASLLTRAESSPLASKSSST